MALTRSNGTVELNCTFFCRDIIPAVETEGLEKRMA
jgi:hypothetical protein